jgi:hypothetical protein
MSMAQGHAVGLGVIGPALLEPDDVVRLNAIG